MQSDPRDRLFGGSHSGSDLRLVFPQDSNSPGKNGAISLFSHDSPIDPQFLIGAESKPGYRGTFELKFLINADRAEAIMAWSREHLDADPHSDPELGDGYHVNSLYLDTPHFDVYHRSDSFRQRKYRLRRYGREALVWCELKRKRQGLVRKRRSGVDQSDLEARLTSIGDAEWEGDWFRKQLDKLSLRPVCQVTYQRFARVKETGAGPIRLTIDDHLKARIADAWDVPANPLSGIALLEDRRILEMKFRGATPVMFRRLVEDHQLQVTSFSKYRTSVEECVSFNRLMGDETQGYGNA